MTSYPADLIQKVSAAIDEQHEEADYRPIYDEAGVIVTSSAAVAALDAVVEATGGSDHIAVFGLDDFTLQHPITERFDGSLFDCEVHRILARRQPETLGKHRIWRTDKGIRWERLTD